MLGDSLSKVVREYGLDMNWLRMWALNGNVNADAASGGRHLLTYADVCRRMRTYADVCRWKTSERTGAEPVC